MPKRFLPIDSNPYSFLLGVALNITCESVNIIMSKFEKVNKYGFVNLMSIKIWKNKNLRQAGIEPATEG